MPPDTTDNQPHAPTVGTEPPPRVPQQPSAPRPLTRDESEDAVKDGEDYRARSTRAFDAREPGGRSSMPRGRYLCTGRDSPIRCGNCGHNLDINDDPHGASYPDGSKRQRYVCKTAYGGCGNTIADRRVLDDIVNEIMLSWLRRADTIRVIEQAHDRWQVKRRPFVEQIMSARQRIAHWGDLFNEEKISAVEHTERIEDLYAKILEAETRLHEVDAIPVPDIDEAGLSDIRDRWTWSTDPEKRAYLHRAWRGFRVEVDPGPSTGDHRQVRSQIHPPRLIAYLVRGHD